MIRTPLIAALALLAACPPSADDTSADAGTPHTFQDLAALASPSHATTASPDGTLYVATDAGIQAVAADGTVTQLAQGDRPPGVVTFLHAPSEAILLARVHGKGLYRTTVGSDTWRLADDGLANPALDFLNPGAKPVPMAAAQEGGTTWLAALGGVYRSDDLGQTWTSVDVPSEGTGNLAYTGIAASGDHVVAVSMLPSTLIPDAFSNLIVGTVFRSTDGGATFSDSSANFPSNHATSVALSADGTAYIGTMDMGVLMADGDSWLEVYGPTDVVDVEWVDGGLSVASATRGLWRLDGDTWTATDVGPMAGLAGDLAVAYDGAVSQVVEGDGPEPPEDEEGTVHVALSFHVNYYHSYRGDTNDDEGFGQDIRVIERSLEWLAANPEVHADWDMDNAFSTDDWMVEHSPDILTTIEERVSAGTDDVRLMSWNNGAMSMSTREEFDESIRRAYDSNEAAFGRVVNGVQPQENMFTPEHIGWYRDAGVEWITLFNAANPFTGIREDIALEGYELYNPVTLTDPDSGREMTLVPVYHHADLVDHGGLKGWVRQLSAQYRGTVLLVIHFDADSESWENFDQEITAVADEEHLVWTNIQTYLDAHTPVASVPIQGDIADGTGDGFQSWAEKDFNHQQWTRVVAARRTADLARFLGDGDTNVEDELAEALEPRLLALSTTNYGLAMPYLADDRVVSATAQANQAKTLAETALATALDLDALVAGELEVVNPRDSAGPALLAFTVRVPTADYVDPTGVVILDGGAQVPRIAQHMQTDGTDEVIRVEMVRDVAANSRETLTWTYDMDGPNAATGTLTATEAPATGIVQAPWTQCAGAVSSGTSTATSAAEASDGLRAWVSEDFTLDACDGAGTVTQSLSRWDGLPGTVVDVQATLGTATTETDLQSVVLSPIACEGGVADVRYQTHGGTVRERPARQDVETWNGQSPDGWVDVGCTDTSRVQISHDTTTRTSPAFLPLSNEGGAGVLAPMGTLYGDPPWHESRRTGGHGIGDLVTPLVADTFQPAAPDWSGKDVEYRLLVGDGIDDATLDLFAHPPWVRVGE